MKNRIAIIIMAVLLAGIRLMLAAQTHSNKKFSILDGLPESSYALMFSTAARDVPSTSGSGGNAVLISTAPVVAVSTATLSHLGVELSTVTLPSTTVNLSTPSLVGPTVEVSTVTTPPVLSTATVSAYDLGIPTVTAGYQAGREFLEYLEDKNVLTYSRDRWTKVRSALEEGRPLVEAAPQEVVQSTVTRGAPAPLPPGLAVELPYESQLFISGRKLIGVTYKSTLYDSPDPTYNRVNSSSFDMTQELQVRIKGRVGRKINVNVDFDDTSQDKRDISVVYKGDPNEVVQEASFGDITMSLPSTEFVGYSRQLFGVKVEAKYKKLHSWGFFSRTKGLSEIKRFTGNTNLDRRLIPDNGYIGLKYYQMRFGSDLIKSGTVKVYQDDRNQANNNVNTSTITVESLPSSLGAPTTYYTGNFDLLVAGQDYTVDYERGIIIFRNKVGSNYFIAVDYQRTDGSFLSNMGTIPGAPKIIKEETNNIAVSRELKTFYSLGNLKIVRDNGRGNFILQMQDLNGATPANIRPDQPVVPSYPSNITVDFEGGVFNFEPPTSSPFPDDLYTAGNHRFNILAEYHYRVKFVTLRPGIVPQSERVTLDGKVLKADADYFIDYDAGIVTFYNEDRINENTVIEVSYDYAPFGGTGGSTLVGMRSELALTNNVFVGSSFIYSFDAQTQSVPDIRSTPQSLMVGEADSRIQNIKLPFTPLTMSVSGEYAMSSQNPNVMNKALIESMEGIKQEDATSVLLDSWKPAVTPGAVPYYLNDISWGNEQVSRKAINPNLNLQTDEQQQVLDISYNLARQSEVSLVQPLSTIGLDFSQKLYIETWIYGDGNGENLSLEYGTFRKDVNRDGKLQTEDTNRNGVLDGGEDVGWTYINPDGSTQQFGSGNGKLDTEDFDATGIVNTADTIASPSPFGPTNGQTITDAQGNVYSAVTWTGWKLFRIPMNMPNPDEWRAIKQLRLTVKGATGQHGTLKIASISVVGNRWQGVTTAVEGSTVTVGAVNNEVNPEYVSLLTNPDYQSLYNITSSDSLAGKREQALSIKYDVTSSTPVDSGARIVYGRAYDISNYKTFKLFVYGNGHPEDTFFIQAGNDTNYFEYAVPISWTGWRLLTIPQLGLSTGGKPTFWGTFDVNSSTQVVGVPALQNISQFKVGVRTTGTRSGEIWVNEIHVIDSFTKDGYAWRTNADFTYPGWATFGGSRRQYNRDFQTFSAGIYDRDYLEDNAYLNFTRLGFLPINTKINHTLTLTPSVLQTLNNLVSILDEGRVISYTGTGSANFNVGRLPRLGMQYTRTITDSQQIQRLEDRDTASGTFDYSNPLRFPLLPTALSANYDVTNSFFRPWTKLDPQVSDDNGFMAFGALKEYLKNQEYNTDEITENWGGRTPFQFWTGFTLSPSYSIKRVREKNTLFAPAIEYPKALSQNVAATSALKLFPWLQPSFSYSISTIENYNLTYSTMPGAIVYPSQTKYIERDGAGEINWSFQVKDILKYRYVQSLGFSSSFRIQDSDSYDNVYSSFTSIGTDKLWIRDNPLLQPLAPGTTGYIVKSLVQKNDIRVSGRYNPFEAFNLGGRLAPLRTLTANFTYTGNDQHSYITGTQQDVYTRVWPDLVFGLNQLERVLWLERWFSDSQFNLRTQKKTTETAGVAYSENITYGSDWRFNLLKRLDMSLTVNSASTKDLDLTRTVLTDQGQNLTWGTQGSFTLKKWRFTLRYDNSQNWVKDGNGNLTTQLFDSIYTCQVYYDLTNPTGLRLPFLNRTLPLTNRLIVNSTLKYDSKTSSLNVERDNTNNYSINGTADYEVSQNFRLSVGLAFSRLENRVKSDESYNTIEASSRLTIQF